MRPYQVSLSHSSLDWASSMVGLGWIFSGREHQLSPSEHGRDIQSNCEWLELRLPTPQTPPVHEALHTAVWTGSDMIVWGGRDQNITQVKHWRRDTTPARMVGQPRARSTRRLLREDSHRSLGLAVK